ncbi:MAG: ribosome biogenesis GTPase Der [Steroidobacteraceae bacterium]
MLPVVAIVGRPNVGKSTLFNTLTRTRDAIVADEPGVTRDRQYGYGKLGNMPYVLVDTGGLIEQPSGLDTQMRIQTEKAVAEADRIIFLTDARAGLTPEDQFVARLLRKAGKPVVLAINKAEGLDPDLITADFFQLGMGEPLGIAANQGQNCHELMDAVLADLPEVIAPSEQTDAIRVAIIGRPNVGKSTLVNRVIGEERVIASDTPGTTRDAILVPFERDERKFLLVDTAGVRRRSKVEDPVERASVARTLQAIAEAHVVVMVLDAHDVIGEQDASVLGQALERGRVILIAINKWDGIAMEKREEIRTQLSLKLDFVPFAPLHFISARHGTGVGELVRDMVKGFESAMRSLPTPLLTRVMEKAMQAHQPPLVKGRRIKLRYAHQGGRNPPRIVIHGGMTQHVPESYRRYLANVFREAFELYATPVAVEFRTDGNPYDRLKEGKRRPRAAGTMPGRQRRG